MSQLDLWPGTAALPVATSAPIVTSESVSPSGPPHDAEGLAAWLSSRVGRRAYVQFTRNRSTMISSRQRGGVLEVRLHGMFVEAPMSVVHALGDYLAGAGRGAGKVLDDFIQQRLPALRRDGVDCRPCGRFHHLGDLFTELNAAYFHHSCTARITWGQAGRRGYRRTIQLGCYVKDDHLIRIHPCLDQVFVPRYYVAWIVFHEMLHEVFGVERAGGRRSVHPPEFVAVEESYPDYQQCKRWEEANIHRLLRYRPERARPRC